VSSDQQDREQAARDRREAAAAMAARRQAEADEVDRQRVGGAAGFPAAAVKEEHDG
jgi:hypothetical protein